MQSLKVGIIGLGAIGSRLVKILVQEFSGVARLTALCDLHEEKIREMQRKWAPRAKALPWPALVKKCNLIIEAASQEIALPVAKKALQENKQVLILSVGGLLVWNGLTQLVKKTRGKLWIPSGALAGVDALLAARQGRIRQVTLTTRKPAAGLGLRKIRKRTLVFEGNAAKAVRLFPKNVNVAATLALAGLGAEKTRVKIYASPTYRRNQHEVVVEGDFGRFRTEVENLPAPDNPRTSQLAVLSAVATLKKIFGRVSIGT